MTSAGSFFRVRADWTGRPAGDACTGRYRGGPGSHHAGGRAELMPKFRSRKIVMALAHGRFMVQFIHKKVGPAGKHAPRG